MVTFDSIGNNPAIVYTTVQLFPTCKDINHGPIIVLDVGEGGVGGCIKEGILDTELVGKVKIKKVGTTCVLTGGSIWAKDCI